MAAPDTQLAGYQNLLQNSRSMLLAAREQRWDELTALEAERELYLSHIAHAEVLSTVAADVKSKLEMIQSILDCDEQAKALVNARKTDLVEAIDSLGNVRKLSGAYGSA